MSKGLLVECQVENRLDELWQVHRSGLWESTVPVPTRNESLSSVGYTRRDLPGVPSLTFVQSPTSGSTSRSLQISSSLNPQSPGP